jgi:hypothetical protein
VRHSVYEYAYIIYLSMALQPLWVSAAYLVSSIHIGRISRTGDQPVSMPLPTNRTTQTLNKRTQCVGFEPTFPAFERAKIYHALEYGATAMDYSYIKETELYNNKINNRLFYSFFFRILPHEKYFLCNSCLLKTIPLSPVFISVAY